MAKPDTETIQNLRQHKANEAVSKARDSLFFVLLIF